MPGRRRRTRGAPRPNRIPGADPARLARAGLVALHLHRPRRGAEGQVVGRKVRQGPLRFGTSAVFASGHDPEVHELAIGSCARLATRAWPTSSSSAIRATASSSCSRWTPARRSGPGSRWARSSGSPASPTTTSPAQANPNERSRTASRGSTSRRTSGSRRRWPAAVELRPREFLRHYVGGKKVQRRFAADDPRPALAISVPCVLGHDANRARRPARVHASFTTTRWPRRWPGRDTRSRC